MLREMLVISALNVFLAFATGFALASGEEDAPQPDQAQEQQQNDASQMMMKQEQIIEKHHARMKEQSQGAW